MFPDGEVRSRTIPGFPIDRVQSDEHTIPAAGLIFMDYFRTDGPILVFDFEEIVEGYIWNIEKLPGSPESCVNKKA